MTRHRPYPMALVVVVAGAVLAGCAGSSAGSSSPAGTGPSSPSVSSPSSSNPASSNPSSSTTTPSTSPGPSIGTAPNGTLFQTYRNAADGYSIVVPGGWKRKVTAQHAHFARFGDVEMILIKTRKHPMTLTGARTILSNLQKAGTATHVTPARAVTLGPHDSAFVIGYRMKGTVSGKPTELSVNRYLFSTSGKFATLILSSPLTVNNTAAYRLIAASFRWI